MPSNHAWIRICLCMSMIKFCRRNSLWFSFTGNFTSTFGWICCPFPIFCYLFDEEIANKLTTHIVYVFTGYSVVRTRQSHWTNYSSSMIFINKLRYWISYLICPKFLFQWTVKFERTFFWQFYYYMNLKWSSNNLQMQMSNWVSFRNNF